MSNPSMKEVLEEVRALKKRVTELEDVNEIRKLQFMYGYYIDKCLYQQVHALFSTKEEPTVVFHGGIYKGSAGVRRLYIENFQKRFVGGRNGPNYGFLLDHPQLQEIINIDEDGLHAHARARSLMQAGLHELALTSDKTSRDHVPRQWWEGGIYENRYVKEDGKWRILVLNYHPLWHGTFEEGWAHTKPEFVPFPTETYPKNETGPDELDPGNLPNLKSKDRDADGAGKFIWPDAHVVPFHYPHPITGKWLTDEEQQAPKRY